MFHFQEKQHISSTHCCEQILLRCSFHYCAFLMSLREPNVLFNNVLKFLRPPICKFAHQEFEMYCSKTWQNVFLSGILKTETWTKFWQFHWSVKRKILITIVPLTHTFMVKFNVFKTLYYLRLNASVVSGRHCLSKKAYIVSQNKLHRHAQYMLTVKNLA